MFIVQYMALMIYNNNNNTNNSNDASEATTSLCFTINPVHGLMAIHYTLLCTNFSFDGAEPRRSHVVNKK